MRQFLLPEEGHVWCKRDFSGQELRIAAHFEDGPLLAAYQANPSLDPHQMAKELILEKCHKDFKRKHVKIAGFQIIYGGGANAISSGIGCSYQEAVEFKEAYFTAMPGIKKLAKECTDIGRNDLPITTWGGRIYYKEPSKEVKGRYLDFSYKLINYLIQGSAADQTKQVTLDWERTRFPGSKLLSLVHDEINISVPIEDWAEHMAHLKEVMDAPLLDCPMRSEGFVGENWYDITACE